MFYLDFLAGGNRPHDFSGRVDNAIHVNMNDVERQFSGNNPGDVQNIFDYLRLRARVSFDRFDSSLRVLVVETSSAKHRCPAKNCAQRCTQLMRDGGKKFVFHSIGVFRVLPRLLGALQQTFDFRGTR